MNERARKEPPRDPGAYIGRRPERWTESVDRNPGRGPGRPGMRRGPGHDRAVHPEPIREPPAATESPAPEATDASEQEQERPG